MSDASIEAADLTYTYPDGCRAVAGLAFHIPEGTSVGLVGANGAGKSTLLMLLSGLLRPDRGRVAIGGVEVRKGTLPEIRRRLGYVFQDSDDQLFMPTVAEDVAFGPRNLGLSEPETAQRVSAALGAVGIAHLADRPPFKLSGGEKRAAAIAAVLAMGSGALVMDEPSAGLDPRARRTLADLLAGLPQTKLIASHDLDFVWETCSRVIVLSRGMLYAEGPTAEILGDGTLMERAGLELPLGMRNCPRCGIEKTTGVPL